MSPSTTTKISSKQIQVQKPKKTHPTKNEENTRHHDVTFNFHIVSAQTQLINSTLKKTPCQGVGLVMQACWVGVGDAQIFQVPNPWRRYVFFFKKKDAPLFS